MRSTGTNISYLKWGFIVAEVANSFFFFSSRSFQVSDMENYQHLRNFWWVCLLLTVYVSK